MTQPTHCPRCGNRLFDGGLVGEPLWCGACDLRTPRRPVLGPVEAPAPVEADDVDLADQGPAPMLRAGWWVACPTYPVWAGPKAAAERRLAEIEALGACPGPHRLHEVPA